MSSPLERAEKVLADIDAPECRYPCSGANEYETEPCRLPAGHSRDRLCSWFKPTPDPGLLREMVQYIKSLQADLLHAHVAAGRVAQVEEDRDRVCLQRDEAQAQESVLEREMAELRLALLNERGAGSPPSEGWEYSINGPCYNHPETLSWVRPRPAGCGWRWYRYGKDENGFEAQGEADTAREAMQAATKNYTESR